MPTLRACLGGLVTLAAAGWQLVLGMNSPHSVHSVEGKGTHKLSWFLPSPSLAAAPLSSSPLQDQVVTGFLLAKGAVCKPKLMAVNWHSPVLGEDPPSCCHSQLFPLLCFLRPLGKAFMETEERRTALAPRFTCSDIWTTPGIVLT